MPFNYLLTNLLVDVPASVGAILVDPEGEAVEWVTRHDDPYDLKVEGAYHSIFMRQLESALASSGLGELRDYTLSAQRLTSLTQSLPDGYYVVLVIDRGGSQAQAMEQLRRTAQVLAREIA